MGNYLWSMDSYLDGINYTTVTGTTFSNPAKQITPTQITDPTFGTIYSYTFTPTTDVFSYFKVDIKSQNPVSGGGNASQMVYFKKI